MKFLFFTDIHAKTKTPRRRTGSFENDILGKLAFLLITAQDRGVDFVVCGGDLFDLPNPSFRLAGKIMRLISSSGIPWLHVLGNHDILGHNPESYDLGVLGFFEHLRNFEIFREEERNGLKLKAVHYQHAIEEMQEIWKSDESNQILFAHAMVTPQRVPFLHVTPSEIKTKARLVLLGHYHNPWANVVIHEKGLRDEVKKKLSNALGRLLTGREETTLAVTEEHAKKFTLYLNPGSVGRVSALAHNIKRTPRAFLVEVPEQNEYAYSVTSIPILVARPSDEAFNMDEVVLEKGVDGRIEDFLAAMENVRVEGIEATTVITRAALARAGAESIDELPPDQRRVLDYALNMIGKLEGQGG